MDIKKWLNREIIIARAKKICASRYLREPLFYVLFLLSVLYLVAVPAKMEFSDIKITKYGKTESIELPYLVDMASGEEFTISYNLLLRDKKAAKFKVIPDDCIQEVLINGKRFSLDGVQGLCDYTGGVDFDFSGYVIKGLNHFDFRIKNGGGPAGLRVEMPYKTFNSLSLIQHIFVLLFIFFIVFVLKKLHNVKLNLETIFVCALVFPAVIYAFMELCIRINYELSGAYQVWDAPIYYAVGRGIANGIAPWSGLWEIKPPGIFLVSAISFKFFDSLAFTYYFQVFILLLTAAVPTVAYFLLSNHRSISKFALSLLAGLLLALYNSERSGEFQVESFGAAFACIAIFAMAVPNFEKRKILWMSLSAIGILGACGFKEPFLFPLFGVSLILCKGIKEWAWRFALPLGIAILFGFVFLLVCGWLDGFFHYFNFMFSTRHGSSFGRALELNHIYNDLNSFSRGFSISLLILLFLPFIKFFRNTKTNEEISFVKILFFGVAFFLSSYSVGLGGEFFEHHFIFALPFYMALVLLLLKNWDGENPSVAKLGLLCLICFVIGTIDLPYRFERNQSPYKGINHFHLSFEERTKYLNDNAKDFKEAAAYLDKKMDELGIDRYAFIGGHTPGTQIYGWTKHSPMGKYFNQQPQWLGLGALDSLIFNLEKADAVVVGAKDHFGRGDYFNSILNEQFTGKEINRFSIYFRKSKMRE
ncbi:MAG: hypothetical protein LBC64_03700 [Fibromonadaceae bacterium]|jgi:hypothetical protein|nr:hypothetical protein [Fibromonadaceae bacterium]